MTLVAIPDWNVQSLTSPWLGSNLKSSFRVTIPCSPLIIGNSASGEKATSGAG